MQQPLRLALTGDVMLGRLVNQAIAARGFVYPWGDLLPLVRDADLLLINLECAITQERERWHAGGQYKAFYFRADPHAVGVLTVADVACATLANNHIGDFGITGLLETIQRLDAAGIAHAGAGAELATARAPARLRADGWRVAVVAFADHPDAWAATATTPGLNYTPISTAPADFAPVESVIRAARNDADLVIFSIHWGPNFRPRPPAAFQEFAHQVIDAGADLFWGHSAHIVQGIEFWQGRPILYDTGDFIDDYAVDAEFRNDLSALFLVQFMPGAGARVALVPVQIAAMQVTTAHDGARQWFLDWLTARCAELGTEVVIQPGERAVMVRPAPPG